jgi:3-methyladenine DNA glycosylase/8-oxoguanine DNA glycosylase
VANGYGAEGMVTTTPAVLGAERVVVPLTGPLDLIRTCARFVQGRGDPCNRVVGDEVWRATRTPDGPATLRLRVVSGQLEAQAWGPGSGWALRTAPATAGLLDPAESFDPPAGPVRRLNRMAVGLRIPATGRLLEILVPTVIAQKVTGQEAFSAWRRLVRLLSGPAPGHASLMLPPAPEDLAGLPGYRYHPLGMERRRAETVRRVASRADWLEGALGLPLAEMYRRVTSIPGVGWWTAAESLSVAAGDADAVQVGDFHLPNQLAWNLAGEPRGDDARMIDLLEPFRGHRQRVIRLVETVGSRPPAFGPRHRIRSISDM